MRKLYVYLVAAVLGCHLGGVLWAKEFKLIDGSTIYGEVSGFDDNGVVFKLDTGGFSKRTSFSKFDQDSLKLLAENAKLKPQVEPFIEIPPEAIVKPKPKEIVIKEVQRVERPAGRTTFFSSFTAPLGLAVLGALYLANLLAGYEIAIYRNRPVAVVCSLSALLPLLGPLIFMASPTLTSHSGDTAAETVGELGEPGPAVAPPGSKSGATSRKLGSPAPQQPGAGLRVADHSKGGAAGKGESKAYNRGDYTFNRRFIETQFAGFFRVVPSEAEKDLVIVFKTQKQEYIGRRISRISSNDLFLQLQAGGGTKEVSVAFAEIAQIEVRQKSEQEKA